MTNAEILAASAAHEIGVYARQPVAFVRGRGCELWDADGRRYLDFFAGLAVTNLGHCHPAVVQAIHAQADRLLHVSNHYHTVPAAELTALLCRHSFAERVFLCNSGAEANEAAMKLARRWGADRGGGRYEILATTGSFHGRTFATLTGPRQGARRRDSARRNVRGRRDRGGVHAGSARHPLRRQSGRVRGRGGSGRRARSTGTARPRARAGRLLPRAPGAPRRTTRHDPP